MYLMKKFARSAVVAVLGWQVRRLRKKNDFKIIGIVGSIGKTSTKFAIAHVLKQTKVVRFQEGNYNDPVTVPLVFFRHETPSLFNPFAWLRVFIKNEKQLRKKYPYDVVVVELGTDAPGTISQFAKYLHCDLAVVTAITPEHMEYFKTLSGVAKEELSVSRFSDKLVVNSDLVGKQFLKGLNNPVITYGQKDSNFRIHSVRTNKNGSRYQIEFGDKSWTLSQDAYGLPEIYSATAAVAISQDFGVNDNQLKRAVSSLQPVNGRMKRLKGIKNSLILDDTYNASPDAVIAALDILYALKAPQKIAILGNMNELGDTSAGSHQEVGEYCEPEQLDLVVTIGPDANNYLAPVAKKRGCVVHTFDNPYAAAHFIEKNLEKKAIILAKGSQNGVFAEEAVKQLLADPSDVDKLVRQSKSWLKKKQKNFQIKK